MCSIAVDVLEVVNFEFSEEQQDHSEMVKYMRLSAKRQGLSFEIQRSKAAMVQTPSPSDPIQQEISSPSRRDVRSPKHAAPKIGPSVQQAKPIGNEITQGQSIYIAGRDEEESVPGGDVPAIDQEQILLYLKHRRFG